jgi:SAM-dependent methyltransferase
MRFLERRRVVGIVDTRGSRIQGWAFEPKSDKPVTIEFFVDGGKVGSTLADGYRRDLTDVCPGGRCAFDFTLPAELQDGTLRTIEVRAAGARRTLTHGRFITHLVANEYHAGVIRWLLRHGLWTLRVNEKDGALDIDGWYIPAPEAKDGRITVNGRAVDVTTSEGSAEWRSAIPPRMSIRTFKGTVPLGGAGDALHFSLGLERAFNPLQDYHYPLFEVATPALEHRQRVDDQPSGSVFNLGGYSTAITLDTVARRFAGRPLAQLGPVLDWGCGCGRVARFVARFGAELSGADIDAGNVRWCSEHIAGRFTEISADPPTPFADDSFGAIYGVSVFTHLNQQYEKLWLAELHRIAKPGALLLLSVLGGLSAGHAGLLEYVLSPEFADGFVDIGRNSDIDIVTKGSTYYRNVFHQPGYITKIWGEYFEILSIEEGIIGNRQDLVVARKPL